jgi:hypothetical protein
VAALAHQFARLIGPLHRLFSAGRSMVGFAYWAKDFNLRDALPNLELSGRRVAKSRGLYGRPALLVNPMAECFTGVRPRAARAREITPCHPSKYSEIRFSAGQSAKIVALRQRAGARPRSGF